MEEAAHSKTAASQKEVLRVEWDPKGQAFLLCSLRGHIAFLRWKHCPSNPLTEPNTWVWGLVSICFQLGAAFCPLSSCHLSASCDPHCGH